MILQLSNEIDRIKHKYLKSRIGRYDPFKVLLFDKYTLILALFTISVTFLKPFDWYTRAIRYNIDDREEYDWRRILLGIYYSRGLYLNAVRKT